VNCAVRFLFANVARLSMAVFVAVAALCFVTTAASQNTAVMASVPNGTASNEMLRLTQSEQSLASANDQYITSVCNHNLAKLTLARAIGVVRINYKQYLGEK
jgi:hypothetical protein